MYSHWEFLTQASIHRKQLNFYPLVMQLNVQPNYQTTFEIIEYIFRYAAQLVVERVRTKHKQSRVRRSERKVCTSTRQFRSSTYCDRKFYLHEMCDGSTFHVENIVLVKPIPSTWATTQSLCMLPFIWNKTLWFWTQRERQRACFRYNILWLAIQYSFYSV